MKLTTARRGGRAGRKGAKAWVWWRAAKRAAPDSENGHSTKTVIAAAGVGGLLGWALSKLDKRRRHTAVQRAAAIGRRLTRRTVQKADYAAGKAKGTAYTAATAARPEREYDDVTLARKVETELFRPADAPKDRVSVNVAAGVVELRGEVPNPAQVQQLADAAKRVEGVKDVHNLLHVARDGQSDR